MSNGGLKSGFSKIGPTPDPISPEQANYSEYCERRGEFSRVCFWGHRL